MPQSSVQARICQNCATPGTRTTSTTRDSLASAYLPEPVWSGAIAAPRTDGLRMYDHSLFLQTLSEFSARLPSEPSIFTAPERDHGPRTTSQRRW